MTLMQQRRTVFARSIHQRIVSSLPRYERIPKMRFAVPADQISSVAANGIASAPSSHFPYSNDFVAQGRPVGIAWSASEDGSITSRARLRPCSDACAQVINGGEIARAIEACQRKAIASFCLHLTLSYLGGQRRREIQAFLPNGKIIEFRSFTGTGQIAKII